MAFVSCNGFFGLGVSSLVWHNFLLSPLTLRKENLPRRIIPKNESMVSLNVLRKTLDVPSMVSVTKTRTFTGKRFSGLDSEDFTEPQTRNKKRSRGLVDHYCYMGKQKYKKGNSKGLKVLASDVSYGSSQTTETPRTHLLLLH